MFLPLAVESVKFYLGKDAPQIRQRRRVLNAPTAIKIMDKVFLILEEQCLYMM